jgi:uncharacterized protein
LPRLSRAMLEPLTPLERRVLGVLVEKALTQAAPEPLTLNALVTGCNQKSNRDPVMSVEDPEADECLEGLQRRGLVFKITGGRVERWRHNLYDAWQLSKGELALLAELLLRGPQTAAEARSRASRMEPLDHEEAARVIKGLVDRGMVIWLTPENRRGAVLTHGFHPPDELARLRSHESAAVRPEEVRAPAPPVASPTAPPDQIDTLRGRLDEAVTEIGRLRSELQQLRATVQSLQAALGVASGESSGNRADAAG